MIICLGGFAWQALWVLLAAAWWEVPCPRPAFAHGAEAVLAAPSIAPEPLLLLGCYHPSQQNTFTGRVTPEMADSVLVRAREFAGYQP